MSAFSKLSITDYNVVFIGHGQFLFFYILRRGFFKVFSILFENFKFVLKFSEIHLLF